MNKNVKKLVTLSMMAAIAYLVMYFIKIPIVLFLKYEPKDVIITIGGFIYGPMSAFLLSVVVSFVEMFTGSETGIIGCAMNIISTCAFACTAAFIYKNKKSMGGAVLGLVAGMLVTVPLMLLWNYYMTPLYMEATREQIASMLIPAFLPFNVIKCSINIAITLLLYKPVVTALRRAHLLEGERSAQKGKFKLGGLIAIVFAVTTAVLVFLLIK